MASTITALIIAPQPTSLTVGQSVALVATPIDAQGNVVLIAPGTLAWSTSSAGVATIDGTGKVTGIAQGQATITVLEPESGKTASLTLSISGVLSINLPKATAYQINASHSGSTSWGVPLTFPAKPTWRVNLGSYISYALVAQGKVFVTVGIPTVGSAGTSLYALDETTGNSVWGPVVLGSVVQGVNLTYENGKLFALNVNGQMQAFDAGSGAVLWSVNIVSAGKYGFSNQLAAVNGIIYFTGFGFGNALYAVDETNGAILWTVPNQSGGTGSPAVSLDSTGVATGVFITNTCWEADFDPKTGAIIWQNNTEICSGGGGETPAYANGLLYGRDLSLGDTIYDAASGNTLTSFTSSTIPALSSKTAFYMNNASLQAVDIASGQTLWTFEGDGNLASTPIVIDQTAIVVSTSGNLYAVNAGTGIQIWSGNVGISTNASGIGTLTAGEGYVIAPVGTFLTGWHIAGQ